MSLLIRLMWAQDKNRLHGDKIDGDWPRVDYKQFGSLVQPSAREEFHTKTFPRGESATQDKDFK